MFTKIIAKIFILMCLVSLTTAGENKQQQRQNIISKLLNKKRFSFDDFFKAQKIEIKLCGCACECTGSGCAMAMTMATAACDASVATVIGVVNGMSCAAASEKVRAAVMSTHDIQFSKCHGNLVI